jgi:hypothetical protein
MSDEPEFFVIPPRRKYREGYEHITESLGAQSWKMPKGKPWPEETDFAPDNLNPMD